MAQPEPQVPSTAARSWAERGTEQPSRVVIRDLEKTYVDEWGSAVAAIADISGVVGAGRFVSLVGPSGCGKTTLLDIVGGLQRPTAGQVTIDGVEVTRPHRGTAMVFQEDSTLHWRTVLDNVAFGLEVAGVPRRERVDRSRDMVRLVGLADFENRRPGQLSGGMKQRVAIARALALDPQILLMDEPFGALDQQTRMFIGQELLRIWEVEQKSVLFVTHDIHEAVLLSDEVWVFSARPACIREIVTVDLPRPRDADLIRRPEFHTYTDYLWTLISAEVHGKPEAVKEGPREVQDKHCDSPEAQ